MDKRFLTILATLVVIFGGIFIVTQRSNNNGSNSSAQPTNHITGEGAKNVTLVEYGDYQCPVCESYESIIEQIRVTYAKDIKFQFRNLPLPIHPNAFAAARATEAASLQGKFWEMHDTLYSSANWQNWTASSKPTDLFNGYAKQIGIDENQFKSDFASEKVNDTIQADLNEFKKTGQPEATPTFFLDGTYIDNPKLTDQNNRPQLEKFTAIIDAEIAKKSSN